MTARFITFEGLDGSGKSTHLRRVADWLAGLGQPVRMTHEPGGTALGDAIREIFLDSRWERVDGRVEALLIFASRRQHLLEVIEPAVESGSHVLCDRFTDSTYAYQGYGRGVPIALLDQLDEVATGRKRPDRTLLFELPPTSARRRGHGRRKGLGGGSDRLDAEELAFYERVRDGFSALVREDPERFRVISSSGTVEETEQRVRAALADLFPEAT